MKTSRMRSRSYGLTLLELLTVIAIISILASIIVPRYWRSYGMGNYSACGQNLRNIATAVYAYQSENSGAFPTNLASLTPGYLATFPTCPAAEADTYSSSYATSDKPPAFTVFCTGANHDGQPSNTPWYISSEGLGPPP